MITRMAGDPTSLPGEPAEPLIPDTNPPKDWNAEPLYGIEP